MARVKMEDIVDHLRTDMRKALAKAVAKTIPGVQFDQHELFRAFRRAVRRKCRTWESVPDRFVEND